MQRNRHRRLIVIITAITSSLLLSVAPGWAQDTPRPTPAKGEALAAKLCANCHLLPGSGATAVPAGVPTFRAIANKPGQTGDHIAQVLIRPHAPMPDLQMTRDEILDVLAYLETLRIDTSAKPIAPPAELPPPTVPKKS